MTNLAIIGRRGSGKTTISQYLVDHHGYTRHSWAAPVKEIASWAYGPIDKAGRYIVETVDGPVGVSGRWLLQRIGTDALRNAVDQAFWIKVGLRKIDEDREPTVLPSGDTISAPVHRWVNDDTRFPNEVVALRSRGFIVFKLEVPAAVRAARLGAEYDPEADSHPSETEIERINPHYTVDGTQPVEKVVEDILGSL